MNKVLRQTISVLHVDCRLSGYLMNKVLRLKQSKKDKFAFSFEWLPDE